MNNNERTIGIAYVHAIDKNQAEELKNSKDDNTIVTADKQIYALALDKNDKELLTEYFLKKLLNLLPNVITQLPVINKKDAEMPIYIIFINVSNLDNGIGNLSFDVADDTIFLLPYMLKDYFDNGNIINFFSSKALDMVYSGIEGFKKQSNNNEFDSLLKDTTELMNTQLGVFYTNSLNELQKLSNETVSE